ncbi:MAG: LuxR C-terminal-related transcriptional regulator [Candidatus Limnocylindrales bacterium]
MGKRFLVPMATAAMTVGVAFTLLEVVLPVAGGTGTYATASAAIVVAVAVAGLSAGLLAATLAVSLAAFLHLPPLTELHVDRQDEMLGLLLFAGNGMIVAVVASMLRHRTLVSQLAATMPVRTSPAAGPQQAVTMPIGLSVATGTPPPSLIEPLTEREIEVLGLVAAGLSNREIASRLFVSDNTVKTHLKSIHGKLGVSNRTQAVVKGLHLRLIDLGRDPWLDSEAA